LRVVYQPLSYKPWRIEPYHGGAIAISESNDGLKNVVAGCSKLGPYVALFDSTPDVDEPWLNQGRISGAIGGVHPVFGAKVDPSRVTLIHRKDGVILQFPLPTNNPPFTSPELFSFSVGYPMACSTNKYMASTVNFVPAVQLAFQVRYAP
jgi:hypothetical protein